MRETDLTQRDGNVHDRERLFEQSLADPFYVVAIWPTWIVWRRINHSQYQMKSPADHDGQCSDREHGEGIEAGPMNKASAAPVDSSRTNLQPGMIRKRRRQLAPRVRKPLPPAPVPKREWTN